MSSPDPFAVFQDERFRVTEKEWQLARKCLLEIAPQSFKLPRANKDEREYRARKARYGQENFRKRLEELYEKDVLAELYEHLKHSFININGKLLALLPHTPGIGEDPAIAGAGSYAKVKYAIDEKGNEYVVKIEHKGVTSAQDEELSFMQEVGWTADTAVRVLPNGQEQRYTVMPYLGKTLSKSVTRPTEAIQNKTNVDSAIKFAWQVHCAHQGWLSIQGRSIAHHDLKPDNVARDKNGRVHILDWGFAKRGINITEVANNGFGTDRFRPTNVRAYTHQQKDVFALQKSLYVPLRTFDQIGPYGRVRDEERDKCLLTDAFVRENNLDGLGGAYNILGCESPSPTKVPLLPSFIAASIAISALDLDKNKKEELKLMIHGSQEKQQALMVLFFAGVLEERKDELSNILNAPPLIEELSRLAPTIEKRPKEEAKTLTEAQLERFLRVALPSELDRDLASGLDSFYEEDSSEEAHTSGSEDSTDIEDYQEKKPEVLSPLPQRAQTDTTIRDPKVESLLSFLEIGEVEASQYSQELVQKLSILQPFAYLLPKEFVEKLFIQLSLQPDRENPFITLLDKMPIKEDSSVKTCELLTSWFESQQQQEELRFEKLSEKNEMDLETFLRLSQPHAREQLSIGSEGATDDEYEQDDEVGVVIHKPDDEFQSFREFVRENSKNYSFAVLCQLIDSDEGFFSDENINAAETFLTEIILREASEDKYQQRKTHAFREKAQGLSEIEGLGEHASLESIKNILETRQSTPGNRSPFFFQTEKRRAPSVQRFYDQAYALIEQCESAKQNSVLFAGKKTTRH